ncbi:MAG: response regulator [Kofleriaceae bacterium]|nr:response regulator [Kofleriaceae bacterium]MCL4224386.1 response regulator [Myxococcales bacterium]
MTPETIAPDQLLTSTQVGNLLQVNPSSVKKWVNDGHIIAFRTPGGHRRIRASDLVMFLDHHKIPVPRALANAARRRVLAVDDDTIQLKALGRAFKRHADKVEVTLVENGIDALVEIGSLRPHLLLIDIYMPGIDGIEVCRRLKANPVTKDIVVIVTSGRLTGELEQSARAAGARRVLRKPVDVATVLEELGLSPPQHVR